MNQYKSPDRITVFITAGDPSGDVHGARLMRAIRKNVPNVTFIGLGGSHMSHEGLHSLASMKELAVTGFWEVAKKYSYFTNLLTTCAKVIRELKPACFIPIDYPGFNMRLAAHAKQEYVPVVWYIAPQLWAWGKDRAKKLADVVDELLVVFPFEVDFFKASGIRTSLVGHPLLDDPDFAQMNQQAEARLVCMPGSRKQELSRHIPLLKKTIHLVKRSVPDLSFTVPKPEYLSNDLYQSLIDAGAEQTTNARLAMSTASAALIKAGTGTLEAGLLGIPFASFYRTSPITYHLSKMLIKLNSVTMLNILLDKHVVHEYIQDRATPELLAKEAIDLISSPGRGAEFQAAAQEVRSILGGAGAAERAASVISDVILRRL